MKRFLVAIALVCLLGLLAVAVPAVYRQVGERRAAKAAAALEAARAAAAAGDAVGAIERYGEYFEGAGPRPDAVALEEYALLLLEGATAPGKRRDDVVAAFAAAESALRQRPDSAAVRRRLGELKLAGGKHAEAREHLLVARAALEEGDPDADALDLALAKTWIGTQDDERVETILGRLVGFDPRSRKFLAAEDGPRVAPAEAYVLLAAHLRDKRDDPQVAGAVVERALRVHPEDPKVLLAYSRWKLASKDPAAAAEAAARAVEIAPGSAGALLADAQAKAAGPDPAAATAAFAAAREAFPDDKALFLAAAGHLQHIGSAEGASALLEEGLERYPDEPRFLLFLVAMPIDSATLGRLAELAGAARERLGADHPAVSILEGRVAHLRREWAKAARCLERCRGLVSKGGKPRLDMELADCLAALGDHDLALVACQRNLAAGQIGNVALARAAEAQLALGRTDQASVTADRLNRRVDDEYGSPDGRGRPFRAAFLSHVVPSMIVVERSRPVAKRQWAALEKLAGEITEARPWAGTLVRAEALATAGDVAAAIAALDESEQGGGESPVLQARRLELVTDSEGSAAAREAFDRLSPLARRAPAVLVALARAERLGAAPGDDAWLDGVADLAEALPDAADAVDVLQVLAEDATAAGSNDTARDLWRRAAKRNPDDFRAPLALSLLASRAGDASAAAEAAGEVARIEGTDTPRARLARAASLVAAARGGVPAAPGAVAPPRRPSADEAELLREAGTLLVEASNDRPGWQAVAALAADVGVMNGDAAAVLDRLIEARACGPVNAPLSRDLVAALVRAGRFAEADLVRVTVAPATLGGAARTAIEAELGAGRTDSAAALALRAIDVERADAATLVWLGRVLARAGRSGEAGEAFRRATESDQANPEGWLWLARWQMASGDAAAARATIASAVDNAADGPARSLLAARGAIVLGNAEEAESLFDEAVAASGADIGPAGHAIDFRLQRGQIKQAKEFLSKLIQSIGGDLSRTDLVNWAVARLAGLNAADPRRVEGTR